MVYEKKQLSFSRACMVYRTICDQTGRKWHQPIRQFSTFSKSQWYLKDRRGEFLIRIAPIHVAQWLPDAKMKIAA